MGVQLGALQSLDFLEGLGLGPCYPLSPPTYIALLDGRLWQKIPFVKLSY